MSDSHRTFGEQLLFYRKRAKTTQKKLAADVEKTHRTIVSYEKNDHLPDRETVLKIAEKLALTEEETDELLILANHAPYFGTIPGTAPVELKEAYQKSLRNVGLVREFGPPVAWSTGWVDPLLEPDHAVNGAKWWPMPERLLDSDSDWKRLLIVSEPGMGGTTLLRYLAHISTDYDLMPVVVDVGAAPAADPEQAYKIDLASWAVWSWDRKDHYSDLEQKTLARVIRETDTARETLWLLDGLQFVPQSELSSLFVQIWRLQGRVVIVTSRLPAEVRHRAHVLYLRGLETSAEQKEFVAKYFLSAGAEERTQDVLALFAKDQRLHRFSNLRLALEIACSLCLAEKLNGSRVIGKVIDGLLRRGGATSEEERHQIYLYWGGAAMERLHQHDHQLAIDTETANQAWEDLCKRRRMKAQSPPGFFPDLAARAAIVRRDSEASLRFSCTQFRDCMAAVVEDGEVWETRPTSIIQPHFLYVAGLSSDKDHLTKLVEAGWGTRSDRLFLGVILAADYAIEMIRAGEVSSDLLDWIRTGTRFLGQLFNTDQGLSMKTAVLRRLRELDPKRGIQLIEGEMMGEASQWRKAAAAELASALDIDQGWELLGERGILSYQHGQTPGEWASEMCVALEPSYEDLTRYNDIVEALLALKSTDSQERLHAVRFLAHAQLPDQVTLSKEVRAELGQRDFWKAMGLRKRNLFNSGSIRYSLSEMRILFTALLAQAPFYDYSAEAQYFATMALTRLELLPSLLELDPLPVSPLWSLALRFGFWIGPGQVIRINGESLQLSNEVIEHWADITKDWKPVRDWSAQAWGLGTPE